jgi:hypothetical protein
LQCVGELSQCQIIRRSGGVWLFWEDGHSFCVCVCAGSAHVSLNLLVSFRRKTNAPIEWQVKIQRNLDFYLLLLEWISLEQRNNFKIVCCVCVCV